MPRHCLEMSCNSLDATAWTLSGDGTTHRSINMESRFITMLVPDYSDPSAPKKYAQRQLGIQSADSHTSASQLHGLKSGLGDNTEIYNELKTSLGEDTTRTGRLLSLCTGMNSDHASDQKLLARMVANLKKEEALIEVADIAFKAKQNDNLITYMYEANEAKIVDAGGLEAWNHLPAEEQNQRTANAVRNAIIKFGEDAYQKLSPEERDVLGVDLFIWAGCSMHKDMNCTKSGSHMMSEYWITSNRTPPCPLMNRDRAAAARKHATSEVPDSNTEPQPTAKMFGGAVKLLQLLGALLNHKDDKKGEHDLARHYFLTVIGYLLLFPDVSNVRYGSYGDGACIVLQYREHIISYLEMIRDRKNSPGLNHLEQNVYTGLRDIPTLVELIALAANTIAISKPYITKIRGSESSALSMGPFHERVKAHVRHLAANPSLFLQPDVTPKDLCLEGTLYQPEVLKALQIEAAKLPFEDVVGVLAAFFKGSSNGWDRFTEEFAPDGTIASLTKSQRKRAFMPTTNDVNEGALGEYRCAMRKAPRLTLRHYNSMTTYKRNRTSGYMRRRFGARENGFLRQKARFLDSLGLEKQRRKLLAAANQKKVELNRIKIKEKEERAKERVLKQKADMLGVTLETNPDQVRTMQSRDLEKQLKLWREQVFKNKELPVPSKCTKRADRIAACILAIDLHSRMQSATDLLATEGVTASDKQDEGAVEAQHAYPEDPMDTDTEWD